jgi:ketosteroid isomerase-like protein
VSQDPVDVIRDLFAATNERDFQRAMDGYAPDVILVIGTNAGVPNPGTYDGKQAVGEWFGDWFRAFSEDYHFEIHEARELSPGVVFLFATHGGKGRMSGAEVHGDNAYLYRVRDDRVTRVELFGTPARALEAASAPEWSDPETD